MLCKYLSSFIRNYDHLGVVKRYHSENEVLRSAAEGIICASMTPKLSVRLAGYGELFRKR